MAKHNHKDKQHLNVPNISDGPAISIHEIEVLAYRIHGEKGGTDLENWLEAERMLKEKSFSNA